MALSVWIVLQPLGETKTGDGGRKSHVNGLSILKIEAAKKKSGVNRAEVLKLSYSYSNMCVFPNNLID